MEGCTTERLQRTALVFVKFSLTICSITITIAIMEIDNVVLKAMTGIYRRIPHTVKCFYIQFLNRHKLFSLPFCNTTTHDIGK